MNAAESLLADLSMRDIDVTVDGDRLRCRGPKGALTPDLDARITVLKPALIARLEAQEDAIAWRVHIMLATDSFVVWEFDGPPRPGRCSSCDEPQPYDQDGECVLCCLASIRVMQELKARESLPEVVVVVERDMYASQPALMEAVS